MGHNREAATDNAGASSDTVAKSVIGKIEKHNVQLRKKKKESMIRERRLNQLSARRDN